MTDDTSSAAALVTLDVGVYTVQVSSADEGVGEVLVEVYEVTDEPLATGVKLHRRLPLALAAVFAAARTRSVAVRTGFAAKFLTIRCNTVAVANFASTIRTCTL